MGAFSGRIGAKSESIFKASPEASVQPTALPTFRVQDGGDPSAPHEAETPNQANYIDDRDALLAARQSAVAFDDGRPSQRNYDGERRPPPPPPLAQFGNDMPSSAFGDDRPAAIKFSENRSNSPMTGKDRKLSSVEAKNPLAFHDAESFSALDAKALPEQRSSTSSGMYGEPRPMSGDGVKDLADDYNKVVDEDSVDVSTSTFVPDTSFANDTTPPLAKPGTIVPNPEAVARLDLQGERKNSNDRFFNLLSPIVAYMYISFGDQSFQ